MTVYVEDASGNLVTSDNSSVTVAIGPGSTGSGTLNGLKTVAAVNGVATFSNLSVSAAGAYTLQATDSGLTSATSAYFEASSQVPIVFLSSTTKTPIPIQVEGADLTAGDTIYLKVDFVTSAPGQTKGKDLIIKPSVGPAITVSSYGTQTVSVPIMTESETISAYISGADGKEAATIYPPTIKKLDAQSFISDIETVLSAASELSKAVDTVESVLDEVPGWHLEAKVDKTPDFSGDISGFREYASDGSFVSASIQGSVSVDLSASLEGYFGVTFAKIGAGIDADVDNALKVSATYTPNGWTFGGSDTVTGSIKGLGETTVGWSKGEVYAEADLSNTTSIDSSGLVSGAIVLSGKIGADIQQYDGIFSHEWNTVPGCDWSHSLGETSLPYSFNLVSLFQHAIAQSDALAGTVREVSPDMTTDTASARGVANGQFVVTTQVPDNVTAGGAFGFVVSAEDGSGNVNTSFNGDVTANLINFGVNSPALGGTLTVTAANGVATFSGLTLNQPGVYALSVTGSGVAEGVTDPFDVTVLPTQLLLTSQPPSRVTAGAPFGVAFTAEDACGNMDTAFNGPVTIALASNSGGGSLGGTVTVQAANGVATFSDLSIDNPGSGYALKASSGSLTPAITSAIDVTAPGVADRLVVTVQPPANISAGSGFGLVAEAEDSFGAVDVTFNGSVTVSDPSGPVLGGTVTVTAVNGVATFSGLTLYQAEDDYSLSVIASGLAAGRTNFFNVSPLAATRLMVLDPSTTVLPASPFDLDVLATDPNGNIDPNYTGNVTLALTGNSSGATLSGTLTVAAVAGVAEFQSLEIDKPASGYTFRATSAGLTGSSFSPFDVTKDQLVVTTQVPTDVTAGSDLGFVVSAEDGSGNVDTSFSGDVTAALVNFGAGSPALGGTLTVTAVKGVAAFSGLKLNESGTYALSVTGNDLGDTRTDVFNVNALAATQLVVTTQPPSAVTTGVPFEIEIAAEDPYGNVDPTFSGNATLVLANNPGGGALGGTTTVAAVNGVAAFPGLTVSKPDSGYTLLATCSGLAQATTIAFDVTAPNVANHLVMATQPPGTITVGTGFSLVAAAEDSQGNVDTSFNGPVTVTDAADALKASLTVPAVNGVAIVSGLTLTKAVSADSLFVTGGSLTAATSNTFDVNAKLATQLLVLGAADNVTAGSSFGVLVVAADPFGNADATYNGNVTVAIGTNPGSGTLSGTLTVAAVNGVATFSNLSINKAGTGYTLTATDGSLTGGHLGQLQCNPGTGEQGGVHNAAEQRGGGGQHHAAQCRYRSKTTTATSSAPTTPA